MAIQGLIMGGYVSENYNKVPILLEALAVAAKTTIERRSHIKQSGADNDLSLGADFHLNAEGNKEEIAVRLATLVDQANRTLSKQPGFSDSHGAHLAMTFWSEARAQRNDSGHIHVDIRPDQVQPLIDFFRSKIIQPELSPPISA